MHRQSVIRSAVVLALLGGILTACGSISSKTEEPRSASEITDTLELIRSVNDTMKSTTFHSSGTTTALDGGQAETWSDPRTGVHSTVKAGKNGDTYCEDGTIYLGAAIAADTLQRVEHSPVTVPDSLAGIYVATKTKSSCDSLYTVSEGADLAPEQNSTVNGIRTIAMVTTGQSASDQSRDVYQIAATGKPYILQIQSTRDGRTSTTVYDSFGDKVSIHMPPADRTMSIDEFRARVVHRRTGRGPAWGRRSLEELVKLAALGGLYEVAQALTGGGDELVGAGGLSEYGGAVGGEADLDAGVSAARAVGLLPLDLRHGRSSHASLAIAWISSRDCFSDSVLRSARSNKPR
ncbi:hypothetical protein [Streptomyces hesseae]|uniref:Lipoprotein n=1 Tax=Streptomyces hesseae TaxID=3075519 RepID=A0ABU2SW86_9ACTN|nr:hypothetical protein [Streptomyces sp. DSM 40473]MDT0452629.1 hypothetical protein [Streptomyces sp. DSM 40473]